MQPFYGIDIFQNSGVRNDGRPLSSLLHSFDAPAQLAIQKYEGAPGIRRQDLFEVGSGASLYGYGTWLCD